MIVLHSNATGLKSVFANADDLESYMDDYRVIDRRVRDDDTLYVIDPVSFDGVPNAIVVDNDENDAINIMDAD